MFRKNIPEEELASLSTSVRDVIQNPAIFEYRQHELNQAPTPEIVKQAQQIWDFVCELKKELDNMDPKQAKKKVEQLELFLSEVKERDYSYLYTVIQKAKEIAEHAKKLITEDPDFIAVARKDEIYHILATGSIKLGKKELDQIVEGTYKKENQVSGKKGFNFPDLFSRFSATVVPINPVQEAASNFDRCLDEAYKRFSKTKLGEYVKKYQAFVEKFILKKGGGTKDKKLGNLRAELEELRRKLFPEDQRRLETLQLREKTKLEILVGLLPDEDYNRFINHLKRNTKVNAKDMDSAKSALNPKKY